MTLIGFSYFLVLATMGIGVLMTVVRLLIGPKLADRVVALDLLIAQAMGIIAIYAIIMGRQVLVDVAVVLALIGFLAAVAFARYLEKRVEQ